jgi:hypothetical protein
LLPVTLTITRWDEFSKDKSIILVLENGSMALAGKLQEQMILNKTLNTAVIPTLTKFMNFAFETFIDFENNFKLQTKLCKSFNRLFETSKRKEKNIIIIGSEK